MDFTIYVAVLMVLCLEGGETGGHGGKHHDHVKLHVPEFIHHGHHTKVITIHHHHHKPKKEQHHHHHHHHHPKPHAPHGHHYHHHKNTHSIKTTTTKHGGHGKHKHHSHGHHGHHGHHSHHGHHGHHGNHGHHGHGHHHDSPSYSYDPPAVPTFEEDFGSSYTPSSPSYGGGLIQQSPHVHGISHTVKQVKVFDSLPGVIPTNTGSHGYQVTEEGEHSDNDFFTSVSGLQHSYPATFEYLRGAAQPVVQNSFANLTPQSTALTNTHDPFASAEALPTSFAGQGFGAVQNDPFAPVEENIGLPSVQPSADFPIIFQGGTDAEQPNSFVGVDGEGASFTAEQGLPDDTPVNFSREAGIQHLSNTGGVETVAY